MAVGCHRSHAFEEEGAPAPVARERWPAHLPVASEVIELSGRDANALFGTSVAITPDATGDGVSDLVIGAPGANEGRGRVVVVPGPMRDETDASDGAWVIEGDLADGRAGESLATGDVDADRTTDLWIGAPYAYRGAGAAFLVRGGERGVRSLDQAAGRVVGASVPDNLGLSVAVAREDDGTGAVVLAGAPHIDPAYAGGVFAWRDIRSGEANTETADVAWRSATAGAHAGTALSAHCDVDGDGHEDILVGAWGDDSGKTGGAAYLVRGPLRSVRDLERADGVYVSHVPGAGAGTRVLLTDVDADGLCDVLVGAPGERDRAGSVYGFFGAALGRFDLRDADFRIEGANAGDSVGLALAAGDQDGDGVLDLWVGAPGSDDAGPERGAAYLVYGPPEGVVVLGDGQPRVFGRRDGEHFGAALAAGADIDGDRSHDLAVGAWAAAAPEPNSGAVYIIRNTDAAR